MADPGMARVTGLNKAKPQSCVDAVLICPLDEYFLQTFTEQEFKGAANRNHVLLPLQYKLVFLGEQAVGKTSATFLDSDWRLITSQVDLAESDSAQWYREVITRFMYDTFDNNYQVLVVRLFIV